MAEPLSLPFAAARLSAVAARLSAALADEETDPIEPLTCLDRVLDLVEVLSWGLCREPATFPVGGLREIARDLAPPGCGPSRGELPAGFDDQVAQVILGAAVLAEATGVDLDAALARQAAEIRASRAPSAQGLVVPVPGGSND